METFSTPTGDLGSVRFSFAFSGINERNGEFSLVLRFFRAWDNADATEPDERSPSKVSSMQVRVSLQIPRPRIAFPLSSVRPVAPNRPFSLVCSVKPSGGTGCFRCRLLRTRSTRCFSVLICVVCIDSDFRFRGALEGALRTPPTYALKPPAGYERLGTE